MKFEALQLCYWVISTLIITTSSSSTNLDLYLSFLSFEDETNWSQLCCSKRVLQNECSNPCQLLFNVHLIDNNGSEIGSWQHLASTMTVEGSGGRVQFLNDDDITELALFHIPSQMHEKQLSIKIFYTRQVKGDSSLPEVIGELNHSLDVHDSSDFFHAINLLGKDPNKAVLRLAVRFACVGSGCLTDCVRRPWLQRCLQKPGNDPTHNYLENPLARCPDHVQIIPLPGTPSPSPTAHQPSNSTRPTVEQPSHTPLMPSISAASSSASHTTSLTGTTITTTATTTTIKPTIMTQSSRGQTHDTSLISLQQSSTEDISADTISTQVIKPTKTTPLPIVTESMLESTASDSSDFLNLLTTTPSETDSVPFKHSSTLEDSSHLFTSSPPQSSSYSSLIPIQNTNTVTKTQSLDPTTKTAIRSSTSTIASHPTTEIVSSYTSHLLPSILFHTETEVSETHSPETTGAPTTIGEIMTSFPSQLSASSNDIHMSEMKTPFISQTDMVMSSEIHQPVSSTPTLLTTATMVSSMDVTSSSENPSSSENQSSYVEPTKVLPSDPTTSSSASPTPSKGQSSSVKPTDSAIKDRTTTMPSSTTTFSPFQPVESSEDDDPMAYWAIIVGSELGGLAAIGFVGYLIYRSRQTSLRKRQELYTVTPQMISIIEENGMAGRSDVPMTTALL